MTAVVCSGAAVAQVRDKKSEIMVACPIEVPEFTPYGFAQAHLQSLWNARNAVKDALAEVDESRKADNMFTFLTAMMRSTKISINDFICAKRTVEQFASEKTRFATAADERRDQITAAAKFDLMVYDQHIDINDRMLKLLKGNMEKLNTAELSDQISTLQVERGQRWSDLVDSTAMALMILVDARGTDDKGNILPPGADPKAGHTMRITVSKAQKEAIVGWVNEHFPELNDGTTRDKLSDPAKTAELYLKFFGEHLASDDPSR